MVKVIVTLNFDRLIEQALREEGIEPTVVATPADVIGMAPLHTLDSCVVHLHGDYLNPTSMLNTTTELETYNPSTLKLLHRILEDYGLIIAGWSSQYDPALREAITTHYSTRYTLAWIEPGAVTDQAAELRVLKKGVLIPADADTGFGWLADAVDTLKVRNTRHPLTLSVAVETAKRELSGGRVAIGLHDTVRREFARLEEHDDFHLPNYHSDNPYGGYEAIVGRVEEASKISCGLVATLAYWGSDRTDAWWLDELERFATQAKGGGLTKLLAVRTLAGTALFYAAGVAAVSARRYDLLYRIFCTSRINPYKDERESLVAALRADDAFGDSIRLYRLLVPILREALAIGADPLDEAWQRFELLRLTMALMERPEFDDIINSFATVNPDPIQFDIWSLVKVARPGRLHVLTADAHLSEAYRSPLAERLADDLEIELDSHPLVAAGLADEPRSFATALRAVSIASARSAANLRGRASQVGAAASSRARSGSTVARLPKTFRRIHPSVVHDDADVACLASVDGAPRGRPGL
ncbi:hypothetical protein Aple_083990 [Acrocarpospora pleiomorpha]|uniref:Uncharacterized protein n=1 Tax=Acrocarpospora pleiomorpha TaxID=90975 RepID=A0A5M3XX06_9ACTN|nr:hypothetical protein Aple_083990 [Acrocarpospora pleiomorpha]